MPWREITCTTTRKPPRILIYTKTLHAGFLRCQVITLPCLEPKNGVRSQVCSNLRMNLLDLAGSLSHRREVWSQATLPWSNVASQISCSSLVCDHDSWLKTQEFLPNQQIHTTDPRSRDHILVPARSLLGSGEPRRHCCQVRHKSGFGCKNLIAWW